ncbi:Imm32 family immunity protein [Mucilaginibacter sp. KACC 22063]|uniref:Imm32 family immunity protein n=1 Tax=Mucilaginibacter sp. KACC 22063 TaxID=3025666 RepID=UPI0023652F51|nr:hypothetical protein [Mucilaginibacter sp. KACC 22063]WDF53456.1 hypothetical protein PQ461_10915 [Mucilaginibacter sp. KACC 22063]
MNKYKSPISGHLDIFVVQNKDEFEGNIKCWNDILIHGDPEALRSLANMLLKLADLDQETIPDLPIGARKHYHLQPKFDLSNSSEQVIIGRLDAKGTGAFYDRYIPTED